MSLSPLICSKAALSCVCDIVFGKGCCFALLPSLHHVAALLFACDTICIEVLEVQSLWDESFAIGCYCLLDKAPTPSCDLTAPTDCIAVYRRHASIEMLQ